MSGKTALDPQQDALLRIWAIEQAVTLVKGREVVDPGMPTRFAEVFVKYVTTGQVVR